MSMEAIAYPYYHIVLFYQLSSNLCSAYLLPTVYLGKYALRLTTFRPFTDGQAFNITTVLANRSFIYLIIPKNWPISIPVRPIMDVIDRK